MIPYGKHQISNQDLKAVSNALKSKLITQGERSRLFEEKISNYCNVKYAVSSNSGTSSLIISCLAIGLKEGDYLWTSPISFIASANCGLIAGSKIDFVDIDLNTHNLDIEKLEKKLIFSKKNKTLPKAIVVVHMAGLSCDMKKISKLSQKYNFKIIEDASHGLGGSYFENKIGSCKYSDITVFSFHPVKSITSAEGGMCTTNNFKLYKNLQMLRNNGVNKEYANKPKWFYNANLLGFNFRLNELQASLGLSQLTRLDKFIASRTKIANIYNQLLLDLPIKLPIMNVNYKSSWHLYIIRLQNKNHIKKKSEIFNYLFSKKIFVQVHYIPIHTHGLYKKKGFKKNDFPNSIKYYEQAISLPIYPGLTLKKQKYVTSILSKCLN